MKEHDIDRAMKRPLRYWYDDGLIELAAGFVFVLIGLLFYVEATAQPGMLWSSFSALGLPALIIGGGLLVKWLVRIAKERLTYPRTGYVSYQRPPKRNKLGAAAVAAAMAILVALLFTRAPASLAWIPFLQGIIIGGFLAYTGHRFSLTRFYALAVVSALVGTATALSGAGETLGDATYFAATGVAFMISGGLTLLTYLRHTRPPGEAEA
jgi:hypothetical protein